MLDPNEKQYPVKAKYIQEMQRHLALIHTKVTEAQALTEKYNQSYESADLEKIMNCVSSIRDLAGWIQQGSYRQGIQSSEEL